MNENTNIMKSNWGFLQEEQKTEEEILVEKIDEAIRGYHHPYCEELDYYHRLKEKLEKYYSEVIASDLVGKDLIADYISEKIMEIDRRLGFD